MGIDSVGRLMKSTCDASARKGRLFFFLNMYENAKLNKQIFMDTNEPKTRTEPSALTARVVVLYQLAAQCGDVIMALVLT